MRFLLAIFFLSFLCSSKALAFSEEGPGCLPVEPSVSPVKSQTASNINATHERVLKDWQACYEHYKSTQPPYMQNVAMVKIADIHYQLGNMAEAERLYKIASEATEKDLDGTSDKV